MNWTETRGQTPPRDPGAQPPSAADGVEVLTRGPLHEAFAEPVTFDPEPGPIAPKQPPEPVEELPPTERPAGEDVTWIPGYWSWDDERKDFIWVSGIWRAIPPGRQWVPGYFHRSEQGFQWVSGYWASAQQKSVSYLPEPPENLENGPTGEAPSAQHIWVPGCWTWLETRFVWRPGYWLAGQAGWTWVPAHYHWTPGGCVFVDGHWDLAPERRGLLFAPVAFSAGVYRRPNYFYTPQVVIDIDLVVNHLFCRPRYRHYYFGDYYAASYLQAGIFPWFSFHFSRHGYSPWFAHHRAHHHDRSSDWDRRWHDWYRHHRDHAEARPPRTFQDQQRRAQQSRDDRQRPGIEDAIVLARPLSQVGRQGDSEIKLQKVDERRRQELQRQARDVRQIVTERSKLEGQGSGGDRAPPTKAGGPLQRDLPKSPVISAGRRDGDRTAAPPARPQDPKPDGTVKPGPTSRPKRPQPEEQLNRPQRETPPGTGRPGAQPPRPPGRPVTPPKTQTKRPDPRPPVKQDPPPKKPPPDKKDG
jgi:hypothetical protein